MTAARREQSLGDIETEMADLLDELIALQSLSGKERPLAERIVAWGRAAGLEVDLFEADESQLDKYPQAAERHLPLAGRPICVLRLPGSGGGRSLMLNAHSDVVPAGDLAAWSSDPWTARKANGNVFGRGACDMLGGLVSGLWAMAAIRRSEQKLAGDLLLELVPGEEDCVGLGTLASVIRGYEADACIVLEPTEAEPRCASRPGLRFEITVTGRSVHGTTKWLGKDAIADAQKVFAALEQLEADFSATAGDEVFAAYPIARPITVDAIHGGEWQGMICDRCTVTGYFELLPDDDLTYWQANFRDRLIEAVPTAALAVRFTERYLGHRTDPSSPLCLTAASLQSARSFRWFAFNAGCEAGLRANLQSTPTLVYGPGSLAQAHSPDEFVPWAEVKSVANGLIALSRLWCATSSSSDHPGERNLVMK